MTNFLAGIGGEGLNLVPASGPWSGIFSDWNNPLVGFANMQLQIRVAKAVGATAVRLFFRFPPNGLITQAVWLNRVQQVVAYMASHGLYVYMELGVFAHALLLTGASNTEGECNGLTTQQVIAGANISLAALNVALQVGNVWACDMNNEAMSYASCHGSGGADANLHADYFNVFRTAYSFLKSAHPEVMFSVSNSVSDLAPPLQAVYPDLAGFGVQCADFVDLHAYDGIFANNRFQNYRTATSVSDTAHPENAAKPICVGEWGYNFFSGAQDVKTLTSQQLSDNYTSGQAAMDAANIQMRFRWAGVPQSSDASTDYGLADAAGNLRSPVAQLFQARAASRQAHGYKTPVRNTRRRR